MNDELVKRLRNCATQAAPCDACGLIGDISCSDNLMKQAADAIEELSRENESLAKSVNEASEILRRRWIPVAERLPPVDKEVLVVAYGSMMRIWNIHRLDPETADVCWECEDGTLDDMCVVTHWMPLPEPPGDGEAW